MLAIDAFKAKRDKHDYQKVRRAEYRYGVQLRGLARQVGDIINGFKAGDPAVLPAIQKLLRAYAEALTPWANAVAAGMLADVSARDAKMWEQLTATMSEAMRREIKNAPTGAALAKLQAQQVHLIKSIPLEAAERVHKLTMEALADSSRADAIAKEIRRSGEVTASRATLIARTEVGRASTNLGQARAEYVGSEGYIWRTSEDSDVRPSHRKLEGTFHKWSSPPLCDAPNYHAHPGCIFNCRCWPEIVLPDGYKF